MPIDITSDAFINGSSIPIEYTCDGHDISPNISWGHLPEGTKSLTLIADDPDAPVGTWVHWVIYNIPPTLSALEKNLQKIHALPHGIKQGMNDFGKYGYGGPCPPSGTHRYFFKIYALDTVPIVSHKPTKAELLKAMQGHIIDQGEIIGKYSRNR